MVAAQAHLQVAALFVILAGKAETFNPEPRLFGGCLVGGYRLRRRAVFGAGVHGPAQILGRHVLVHEHVHERAAFRFVPVQTEMPVVGRAQQRLDKPNGGRHKVAAAQAVVAAPLLLHHVHFRPFLALLHFEPVRLHVLGQRHQAAARAAERPLHVIAETAADAVVFNLGIAIVENADKRFGFVIPFVRKVHERGRESVRILAVTQQRVERRERMFAQRGVVFKRPERYGREFAAEEQGRVEQEETAFHGIERIQNELFPFGPFPRNALCLRDGHFPLAEVIGECRTNQQQNQQEQKTFVRFHA